jgi:hypothetical protein
VSPNEIRGAIVPLRLVFWGGLLCVLDFSFSRTVNGEGWSFDILSDFVGMAMITVGTMRLARFEVPGLYGAAVVFVNLVAVLCCVDAIHDHFVYRVPVAVVVAEGLLGLASLCATVTFCVAMKRLCAEAELRRSESSWRTTTILFVVIYLIPLGLFYAASLIAILARSRFRIDLGPIGFLLVPIFLVPLIHLFVSTSRMAGEAGSKSMEWCRA